MTRQRIESIVVYGLMAVFAIGYFVVCIRGSLAAPFSADEVFVAWILRTFPPSRFAEALSGGADSIPPGYYYLQSAVSHVFGLAPVWLRLPSIVSYFVFMAGIFWMLRGRVPLAVAALAAMVPIVTASGTAAVLARPYAIVCACFVVAILLWRTASTTPLSIVRSCMLAITIAFAIAMHFFATMFCPTLVVMEALRSWRRGRWYWRHWAAIAAGGASVFLWWSVIGPIYHNTHASTGAAGFYARPTLDAFADMSADVLAGGDFRHVLVVLIGAFALTAPFTRLFAVPPASSDADGDLDIIAAGALSLPIFLFVFAILVTRSLSDRHIYEAVFVTSVVLALALRRLPAASLVCTVLMLFVIWRHANPQDMFEKVEPVVDGRVAILDRAVDPIPIVLSDASDYFDAYETMRGALRDRLVFMRRPAGLESPDPEPELIATQWQRFIPELRVVDANEFLGSTPRFYVLCTSSAREGLTDWFVRHARVRVVERYGGVWLLDVEGLR